MEESWPTTSTSRPAPLTSTCWFPAIRRPQCIPADVSLKTPLVKYRKRGEEPAISLNIPMVSAIMQAVSNDGMAIALATEGGLSFVYGSQTIEDEAAMVARVKSYKKGFIISDSNVRPDDHAGRRGGPEGEHGHSTMPVTDDGTAHGKLLGIVTEPRLPHLPHAYGREGDRVYDAVEKMSWRRDTTLKEANDIIWDNKMNSLPVVDEDEHLMYLVFRKDYDSHKSNPNELLDKHKRYIVGAGINTRDYAERVPALVEAGADVLCIDSSEGYSEWQKFTIELDPRALRRQREGGRRQRGGRRGLPLPGRCGRRLHQGGHRRRLHLHHA